MKCNHDPKQVKGAIGMYHCPECGQMVVAGMEHPDWDKLNEYIKEDTKNEKST